MDGLNSDGTIRCPSCAATLRAGAPWCTLCYTDLRAPAAGPPAVPSPAPAAAAPPAVPQPGIAIPTDPDFDPLTAPAAALGLLARQRRPYETLAHEPLAPETLPPEPLAASEPTWPCANCGAGNNFAAAVCGDCGERFLSGLRRSEAPLLELPVVGDFAALSRAKRLGVAFGVVFVVLAVFALLGLLWR